MKTYSSTLPASTPGEETEEMLIFPDKKEESIANAEGQLLDEAVQQDVRQSARCGQVLHLPPVPGQASGRGAGDNYESWGHQDAIQHQPCHV